MAAAVYRLRLEDGPEIPGDENTEEDHSDDISTGISAQARQMEQARFHAQPNHEGRPGGQRKASGLQFNGSCGQCPND
jgi:hypothetical protein